ncbi:DUF559 domain-containing protein [Limnothrix sp. FACHB-881]|uniref:DUF559 domain-containing protein n=1 Tax=Limnothrix sp. FACHB-881 TaxID=2692819 RepID=UPI001F5543D4|nr:DUF559 domain-containing protein [Limnothrix sp. FACHB-881]
MPLHRQRAQKYLQTFDFESLFIEELGWDTVDRVMLPFEVDGEYFEVVSLAQKRGFTVFKCITPEIPARPIRVKLDRQLTDYSKSHLLVFGDESKTQQEWLWLKPEIKQGKSKKGKGKSAETVTSTRAVRSHSYKVSQNPETLLQKLEALIVDFKEEGNLTHVDVAQKVKQGFDVERVTKQFFQDFEGLHQTFCLAIEGIDSEGDRRWYASVLLNRLMFIYFLQRRYFLDNQDALYLQHKLQLCQREGRNFYEFLKELFFVGFAEPEYLRDPEIQKRLGKICYLNGGLFLRHTIEQKYAQIQIDDRAFSQVFDLFSRYSWHLDDRPEKDPLEINPDVLGYIFEKYINQKEFGAYYTRPEITEYLCDRTINKLVLDRLAPSESPHPLAPSPKTGEGGQESIAVGAPAPLSHPGRGVGGEGLSSLLETLDATQCDRLLNEILPTLTLLDPACGSGAFLVAAMKTLIGIYQRVVTRAKLLLEDPHPLAPSPKGGEGGQEVRAKGAPAPLSRPGRGAGGEGLMAETNPHPLAPSPKEGEGGQEAEMYWEISSVLRQRMREVARQFRKEPTASEAILWQALRGRKLDGRKFKRQQPIGAFIVDFFCAQERLVVEVDGGVHQNQQEADQQRQQLLESLGLRFVRVSSNSVEQDLSTVLSQIRAEFLPPSPSLGEGLGVRASITQWLQEAAKHPSLDYYIKKRIITDNLYGVDIMEEATEIAKLRLFLALVSSAKTVNDLEPLPNIDFNIMAGNSLIGLIRVDGEGFDRLSQKEKGKGQRGGGVDPTQINLLGPTAVQGNLLQGLAASEYQRILEDKNRSIALYKKHAFQQADSELPQETRLLQLRDHIDKLNRESQAKLNQLLLDEFSQRLGIKYEQAQLVGKPQKRLLTIADIDALEPFHWGYHFDRVFARGGFDAIIANPPWEIFKPNAKEFFANHSDLVTKKKMDIKAFEKEQKRLLQDPEVAQAWNEYQSQFPHVNLYFRNSDEYRNQTSYIDGKKSKTTDINLYKLFVERCYNLLRNGGECGIVIPSGIYTDLGTKQLREMLFSQTEVTSLFCFENRKAIFEGVDSRFKFVILSFGKGGVTQAFPVRFMRHDVAELAEFPTPNDIILDVDLIRKLSPDSLSVMEFKQAIDIDIAKKMLRFPLLGEKIENKWNLTLKREFHMTDDSYLFKPEPGLGRLPLYEGKMIHQFTHQFAEPRYWVDEREGRKALVGKNGVDNGQNLDYQGYRLGLRAIARNTDIRTLIVGLMPRNIFCGNSVLSLYQSNLSKSDMLSVLSIANSFVLDAYLRSMVSANINMFYIYQLPVPRLQEGDRWFTEIVERAAKLICTTPEFDDLLEEVKRQKAKGKSEEIVGVTDEVERAKLRAELDGIIAHLYDLTEAEFTHILSTFPIVPEPVKEAALNAYRELSKK